MLACQIHANVLFSLPQFFQPTDGRYLSEDNVTERDALIAMNRVTGLGAITARRMAERFGSLAAVLEASESDLQSVAGIGPDKAHQFWSDLRRARADDELARADKKGIKLVTWVDPGYPVLLKQIADPPLVLYVAEIGRAHV